MPLVIVEGIDGSGKSTLAKALASELRAHLEAFPTHDGPIGKLIRSTFTGETKIAPQAMQHLFTADAIDRDVDIGDRVSRGELVILDRHPTVSGWVYGSEIMGVDVVQMVTLGLCFTPPDLVVLLDVPAEVALSRLQARGGADKLYEAADQKAVEARRNRYQAYYVMHHNVVLVDGQKDLQHNLTRVAALVRELVAGTQERN